MTKLGDKTAAPAAPTTRIGRHQAVGLRGEEVTLPVFGRAYIELAGHRTVNAVEAATFAEMAGLKLELSTLTALSYEAEKAVRTLAASVRDPDDPKHELVFGTLEEWARLDPDLISACWQVYQDVRERLDPIGSPGITDDELRGIAAALQKKSATALRYFGVAKLSLYLLITAEQLATSPTPASSPGPISSTTS